MSQRITGVQRYAREILAELDGMLTKDRGVVLAIDSKASDVPVYKNISVKKVGHSVGSLWEQTSLPVYVLRNHALCVSLCNMMPILTPHLVVLHDISFKVNPAFYSRKYLLWYNLVYMLSMRRIRKIITVSQFSRGEIYREYGKKYRGSYEDIEVIYNAWQHFGKIEIDVTTLQKYGLTANEYYFGMGSMSPNKNINWIIGAAKHNPHSMFVVSGAINSKVFGSELNCEMPENLKLLGYLSDREAKTLMKYSKAFLFPTFYEGFGIPPLEALSTGAKAVVSDTECMKEIYGDSVYYINPWDSDVNLDQILSSQKDPTGSVLDQYSWCHSAEKLYDILAEVWKE